VRDHGIQLPANIVRHLEGGLWEARPEYGGIEYRFVFFLHPTRRIGIVAAFAKKRQKMPRAVIEQALQRAEVMRQAWREGINEQG
jgi:phage-related protein